MAIAVAEGFESFVFDEVLVSWEFFLLRLWKRREEDGQNAHWRLNIW